jgi:tetrahydromethanopterin S-methyltransferase subunit G
MINHKKSIQYKNYEEAKSKLENIEEKSSFDFFTK